MFLNLFRELRSYKKRVAELTELLTSLQFVQPTFNGGPSCIGCGNMKHWGCEVDCPVNKVVLKMHPTTDDVNKGADTED